MKSETCFGSVVVELVELLLLRVELFLVALEVKDVLVLESVVSLGVVV
jgi:hypothetical protein